MIQRSKIQVTGTLSPVVGLPSGAAVKRICLPVQETRAQARGQEDPLEKGVATHSGILAWRIPRTGEPGAGKAIVHGVAKSQAGLTKHKHITVCQNGSAITPHRMWKMEHGLVGWAWSLEPDHPDSRPSSAITSCVIPDKLLTSLGLCFLTFKMTVVKEPYQIR